MDIIIYYNYIKIYGIESSYIKNKVFLNIMNFNVKKSNLRFLIHHELFSIHNHNF